ncbi:BRF2 [Branchiostoma lanceolatum]|uniref:Transcription factor IIIB 50 kDa subunit n=1 Tax=Branchiostoma lanceolatum TaxID=7740 RepID=A0A8K0ECS1_BRALA|nr:BRF2 [Branchiostoma lanceolatum]
MSAMVCTQCGSQNIQTDPHFCMEQRICTDCGFVLEEGSFQNDPSRVYAPHAAQLTLPLKYRQHNNFHDHVSKARRDGATRVEEICAMLRVTSDTMVEEAKTLYGRAYDLTALKKTKREKKRVLPGCCVYIVCRQHDWPITLSDMWELLQCIDSVFYSVYKVVLTELNIVITVPDIETVVPSVIKKCDLTFDLDDEQIKTVTKIVYLAKNTWISCGRRYDPIIIAAVFLVWKTADYGKRKTTNITSFCRQNKSGRQVVDMVRSRVHELEDVLLKLASEIPWVQTAQINKKNIVCYISDILKYEKTLLDGKYVFTDDDSDHDGEDDERELQDKFLPPSMQNPKATSDIRDTDRTSSDVSVPVSYSTELGENDIPDSEMHKYIKTTKEVMLAEEVMTKAANKTEEEDPCKRKAPSDTHKSHKKKRSDVENTP